jgi:DNA primase
VNYDPDTAGQTATERSISLLLEQDFEVRVLALPGKADPDKFIREQGADAYIKVLKEAPPYVDYLIARARRMDLATGEGKLRAVNFLLPYVQKIPNRILRSEWATRIAQQLRLEEPVLRAALSKAAAERRSEVKTRPELIGKPAKTPERRLIRMLAESVEFRRELAGQLESEHLYQGLETEKIFAALIIAARSDGPVETTEVAQLLEERERRIFFEILFEPEQKFKWREAESCLQKLRLWKANSELNLLQRALETEAREAGPTTPKAVELQRQKLELLKAIVELENQIESTQSHPEEGQDEVLEDVQRMIKESQRRYSGR